MKGNHEQMGNGLWPSDWRLLTIGEIAQIGVGKDLDKPHFAHEQDNKYRFPVYSNTVDGRGLFGFYDYEEYPGNAVTVVGRGVGLGKAFSRDYGFGAIGRLIVLLPNPNCNRDYLAEYINHNVEVFSESSGIPQLTGIGIAKYRIALPSLKEQEAIAEAIGDVDALLAGLERLIAKKRAVKTAVMQELLTGRRRLPGFDTGAGMKQTEIGEISADWRLATFGDAMVECFSGATPYRGRPEFYKGQIPWITSSELNYNTIDDAVEKITSDAVRLTNLRMVPKGTFLMAITGLEAAGTRGSCAITGIEAATNQSCMAIIPNSKLLTEYLFHYYVFKGEELAFKYCQGTKQQSYTAGLVKLLPIALPTVYEQQAIATVLSDIDAEITALEARRAKTQAIKQGMMQELLTGRTRLIAQGAA